MKTFLLPDLLDIKMTMLIIVAIVLVISGILYWIDRANRDPKKPQQKGFAQATMFTAIVGIIAVAGLFFGGDSYHDLKIIQKVSSDYGVDVISIKEDKINVISAKGPMQCGIHSKDQINYYVLCTLPNVGYLPLDEIIEGKHPAS